MIFGGWLLVGRGLAPLHKLSDAVSQVSERDFKLPIGKAELSRELVPIHDRLTQTLLALRHAFEREKQAVADISHELRTPLAAMLTTLEVSLRKPRQAEQYRATLVECRDIGKQLGRLVERIMTLAQMDAGTDRVRAEAFDASEVAIDCVALIRPLAVGHGLTLTTDIAPAAYAYADPDRVGEVFRNLLHNAVEYNRPAGTIHMTVAVDPAGGGVHCEVRDTGIGMGPEVTAKIFERFYRADPSRHATGIHSGLGLAIVKEYLDRMGGTIAVESQPWVGTTFRVTLPAARVDEDSTPSETSIAAAS
ncbi:sensor histidine kinase [Fimbriiglobus ruber]|uniref:histidine kinase n=1 Tax=Fimbriiglobus ruber TaxID=1908690 RepID=A0A225DKR4_9BACT|nr:HAMP domain-containing sensor histidine kinase [Fimbriiglobus ruber]OWK40244.1 sensor histidine kinase [Fimbriiglobus ruber]